MNEGITRRIFFKIVSMASAAFILEKHIGELPNLLESSYRSVAENIDLEISEYGLYWRFPRIEKMSFEEREKYWVEVKYIDKPILQMPCLLMDVHGGYHIPIPIRLSEGKYLVANLNHEEVMGY